MINTIADIEIPVSLDLVSESKQICANGVPLHTLVASSTGVVRLTLVFGGGSSVQAVPFAAASCMSMLSEGSADYSAQQIAEMLDFYGIFFDSTTDRDYCYVTIAALNKFLPQALDLLQSMLLCPLFDKGEFDLYCGKKRQQIILDRSKPSYTARERFISLLFGVCHPYGRVYGVEHFDALCVDDLKQYHLDFLGAERMFAVASGDITSVEQASIVAMIESIPCRGIRFVDFSHSVASGVLREDVSREQSTQSCIRIGRQLINKDHPDFIAMQLLVTVLGGYFGSRLVQNLRETNGYTYGVFATLVSMKHCGYLAIATDVGCEHRDAAIEQICIELRRLGEELVDFDELSMAKSSITGELMRLVDGPFGIADIAVENIQSGMPADYVNIFLTTLQRTTAEDLRRLGAQYFDPSTMLIVSVG